VKDHEIEKVKKEEKTKESLQGKVESTVVERTGVSRTSARIDTATSRRRRPHPRLRRSNRIKQLMDMVAVIEQTMAKEKVMVVKWVESRLQKPMVSSFNITMPALELSNNLTPEPSQALEVSQAVEPSRRKPTHTQLSIHITQSPCEQCMRCSSSHLAVPQSNKIPCIPRRLQRRDVLSLRRAHPSPFLQRRARTLPIVTEGQILSDDEECGLITGDESPENLIIGLQ
jgi:hypothetical protein